MHIKWWPFLGITQCLGTNCATCGHPSPDQRLWLQSPVREWPSPLPTTLCPPNCAHHTVPTTLCTPHSAHHTVHTTLLQLACLPGKVSGVFGGGAVGWGGAGGGGVRRRCIASSFFLCLQHQGVFKHRQTDASVSPVCNPFSMPVQSVIHTHVVLPATLAVALWLQGFLILTWNSEHNTLLWPQHSKRQ